MDSSIISAIVATMFALKSGIPVGAGIAIGVLLLILSAGIYCAMAGLYSFMSSRLTHEEMGDLGDVKSLLEGERDV